MKLKLLLCVMLVALLSLTAVGCADPQEYVEAKPFVTGFFAAVKAVGEAEEDTPIEAYADALTYFHPDALSFQPEESELDYIPLNTFFYNAYYYGGMNFAAENAAITSFNGFFSSYSEEMGGHAYTVLFRMTIGDIEADVEVVILDNERGYGICDFKANPIVDYGNAST